MKRTLLFVATLALVGCTPVASPQPVVPQLKESSSSSVAVADVIAIGWKIETPLTDKWGHPYSTLFITVGDQEFKIGDFDGTTFHNYLDKGAGVAGTTEHTVMFGSLAIDIISGDEFRVDRFGDELRVFHQSADGETASGFELMKTIPLPVGKTVTVIPYSPSTK